MPTPDANANGIPTKKKTYVLAGNLSDLIISRLVNNGTAEIMLSWLDLALLYRTMGFKNDFG